MQPNDEFVQADSWDGGVNAITRETEAIIQKSIDSIGPKIDRISKRLLKTHADD